MTTSAHDSSFCGPTPREQQIIQYLTDHLPEILRHGNSKVYFEVDAAGGFIAHTYEAGRYPNPRGPFGIPLFVNPTIMLPPDVQDLIDWMERELDLRRPAAEQVWVNLQWRG